VLNVIGLRCAVCGATVDVATAMPWRCPRSASGDRHHVLQVLRRIAPLRPLTGEPNPFVAYDSELAWAAFAEANGMTAHARTALVGELDAAVAGVAGIGFRETPFARSDELSDALGFARDGGIWVKDETGNVAGSHKARHLFTILLHLRAAELLGEVPWRTTADRPPLAIASCGNAAIAAATLAAAAAWPIDVFVPEWADERVVGVLAGLGATITRCPRTGDDPPGDPTIHRVRAAVDAGAVPFSVQGPENALCLDGGRTIGWEMIEVLGAGLDRAFVQVGGGAFAACVGSAFRCAGVHPRVHAVQAEGCAPLELAWRRAAGEEHPERRWAELMTPWPDPRSVADGILDDETYDWLGVFDAMRAGGSPVVVTEAQLREAHDLGRAAGFAASVTGTAGLAGVLAARPTIAADERVAVVMSGVERAGAGVPGG
jgi:threonine synthase